MGYVEKAICQQCNYESDPLTVGDSRHFITICHHCNSVVNPEFIPFKFIRPPCPDCGHPVQKSGFVDALMLETSPSGEPVASIYQCPRCKENKLTFQEIVHFRMTIEEEYPQKGEIVHGMIDTSDKLHIPGVVLWNDISNTGSLFNLENASAYERQKPMGLSNFQN